MLTHRKNILDIFHLGPHQVGIFREPFDLVETLTGYELTPVDGQPEQWTFRNPQTGRRGRMLDMGGFLSQEPIALNTEARAYLITRQDFTLALIFPGKPRRIHLNQSRYTVLEKPEKAGFPSHWPPDMFGRVIRMRFKNIALLNEAFLLEQIGLRGTL